MTQTIGTTYRVTDHKAGTHEEVALPAFVGEKRARAAKIVSVGVSPEAAHSRLALEGGAHVDVTRLWTNNKQPQAGHIYVQFEDGSSTAMSEDAFTEEYSPAAELKLSEDEVGATIEAQADTYYPGVLDTPGLGEWLRKSEANREAFGKKLMEIVGDVDDDDQDEGETSPGSPTSQNAPSAADLDAAAAEQAAANETNESAVPVVAESTTEPEPSEPDPPADSSTPAQDAPSNPAPATSEETATEESPAASTPPLDATRPNFLTE